ncbi:endonuclease [Pontimicrobium sp. SW4]|uniref:Endonuclease n=1 Tax=Pontimicrobium sp. SW4 TaxID=3153519 RepID=A0AAU7BVC2_9FLAO
MRKFYFLALIVTINISVFAQQSYYDDVNLTLTGVALKNELANKVTTTHTNVLSYGWDATKATDLNPSNFSNVLLIYGYEDGTDSDCTNDLERSVNSNGGSNCDFNREHVFPKSLGTPSFTSNSIPGADGHHIRASDVQRNGQRGNQKFADGSGDSKNVTGGWYPGDEWKGDAARIIMYMYIRYGNQCLPTNVGVGSPASTPDDMIDLFLKWNSEDPVSTYEDNRNSYHTSGATYSQGNRNPFIDEPYLANLIWGTPAGQVAAADRWGLFLNTQEELVSSVKIFPNPVKDNTIYFSTDKTLDIKIYDVLGKLVVSKAIMNNNYIDISNISKGVYLVRISNNNQSITKKLIRQ